MGALAVGRGFAFVKYITLVYCPEIAVKESFPEEIEV